MNASKEISISNFNNAFKGLFEGYGKFPQKHIDDQGNIVLTGSNIAEGSDWGKGFTYDAAAGVIKVGISTHLTKRGIKIGALSPEAIREILTRHSLLKSERVCKENIYFKLCGVGCL